MRARMRAGGRTGARLYKCFPPPTPAGFVLEMLSKECYHDTLLAVVLSLKDTVVSCLDGALRDAVLRGARARAHCHAWPLACQRDHLSAPLPAWPALT